MMNICLNRKHELRKKYNFATAGKVFIASALLAGCSSMPDWANPVEWYNSASQAIVGDETPKVNSSKPSKASVMREAPSKGFPNLGSVPPRPTYAEKANQEALIKRLKADRLGPKNSEKNLNQQASADIARPAPPPVSTVSSVKNSAQGNQVVPSVKRAPLALPAPVLQSQPLAAKSAPVVTSQLEPIPKTSLSKFLTPFASTGSAKPLDASIRSLNRRPMPSRRSVSKVGNPTFGPPPADIAKYLGAGMPPETAGGITSSVSRPNAGARSAMREAIGKPVGIFHFKAGSANLSNRERLKMRQLVKAYRQRGGEIRVEGHSSSRTRDMDLVRHHLVNFNVSLNRGNTVALELINNGVPKESVFVVALSDSRPIYEEVMPSGDAGNQRVEVYFIN